MKRTEVKPGDFIYYRGNGIKPDENLGCARVLRVGTTHLHSLCADGEIRNLFLIDTFDEKSGPNLYGPKKNYPYGMKKWFKDRTKFSRGVLVSAKW